jgi:beta-glucanase (GH16 family)
MFRASPHGSNARARRNVRIYIAAALCTAQLLATPAHAFDAKNPAASGYVETFSDDFRTIDTSVWENDWWYDAGNQTACQSDFLPGTVLPSSSGLDMHIESLENIPACQGVATYSSAHLDSSSGFAQQYGYFEASIKSSDAGGTLTAFWLLPAKAITWFIDGVQRGQTSRGADEATPMFVIFSLYTGACGDGWAGCPSKTTGWSADAFVQWVRVWKAPAG